MKFLLCSILILAGFIALNDASLTYEEEMRLVEDQLLVEELERMSENRDANSVECSQKLLNALTAVLADYNNKLGFCNQTKEETIADLENKASKLVKSFSKKLENSCNTLESCASLETPELSLSCYEDQGSEEASQLINISNDAATSRSQLTKDIENAVRTEDVCKTQAYASYSDASNQANADFTDCLNGKESKPVSTEAPAEENDEKDEDAEDKRPKFRANKYRRFY